ncbi:acetyltransferase [Humitalea rosea]|uniref:Acetyltransferase n=1 Tax=Humitalea rosea TaxID=990373 RepID=A0A2W7INH0_9PROT|nr:acetate--CoA ligase family protein [Humitalea rosea]PZW48594.1 acetyltransferase [Humitalea rosea]
MQDNRGLYRLDELRRVVDPGVIAVVGASETMGSFGQRTLANLSGFAGKVYGVNPKYREVSGRSCVPSLEDLPETPDSIVLCVARQLVEDTVQQAIRIGAGGAIVYASGFSETGLPARVAEQEQLVATAKRGGLRLVGPNCVGLSNLRTGALMNFMPDCGEMVRGRKIGRVAIVSQSGALGYAILQSITRGVSISHYLAAGNAADVDICDMIACMADDPEVGAITCLFEGLQSGQRFLEAARLAAAAGKPLIVYKAGNGEASGKAALSHTGTLVGSVAAYRAAFEECGAIVVDDLEAVIEMASFMTRNGPPRRGPGVGIMATSGGAGVINADKAEKAGLALPELAPQTRAALEQVVPDFGAVANPADLTAEVLKTASTFAHCLDAFVQDPSFSAVIVPLVFAHAGATGARAPVISDVAARSDCAVAAVWMTDWLEGPGSAVLDADERVTLFRSSERCANSIRAWMDWHARRAAATEGVAPRLSPCDAVATARAVIAAARAGGKALGERDSKRILAAYGIAVPREEVAATPEAAAAAATSIGFPVVVKVASTDILHKTEVEGIRLNLRDAEAVRAATEAVLAAAARHRPEARIVGVSVQSMVSPGVELVLGIQSDQQFGPLVVVGLGGVLVELLGDVATALAPTTPERARHMLSSLRGHKLLSGYRREEPRDIEAAVDVICRFSEMAADLGDLIGEADVNPLIVGRKGAVAADALIVLS